MRSPVQAQPKGRLNEKSIYLTKPRAARGRARALAIRAFAARAIFFIYRYGARVSEAFGLWRKDFAQPERRPIVLFRNNGR